MIFGARSLLLCVSVIILQNAKCTRRLCLHPIETCLLAFVFQGVVDLEHALLCALLLLCVRADSDSRVISQAEKAEHLTVVFQNSAAADIARGQGTYPQCERERVQKSNHVQPDTPHSSLLWRWCGCYGYRPCYWITEWLCSMCLFVRALIPMQLTSNTYAWVQTLQKAMA